ncbi:hypothetical protein CPC08DRAFT_730928 [Agrocybe pediades]|nr:hypothetical protein CPC08DRAFT_730928 [Agrocybe pediades]
MLPDYILEAFRKIPANAPEGAYNGAWTSVLIHFFDIRDGYTIWPQYPVSYPIVTEEASRDTIDMVVYLTVERNDTVVFFLELKAEKNLTGTFSRIQADDQMRTRIKQLYNLTPTLLLGVSAFGRKCCTYELNKETGAITPPFVPRPQDGRFYNVVTIDQWDYNICTQEGFEKFEEVVRVAKYVGNGEQSSKFWSFFPS